MEINKGKKIKIALLSGVFTGIVCIMGYVGYTTYKNNITATEKVIKGTEKKEIINRLKGVFKNLRDNNGYITVIDGKDDKGNDTKETYLFNSKGEAIAQGSKYNYITVFRKDNNAIRYTDVVDFGADANILVVLENALKLADSKKATIEKPINSKKDKVKSNNTLETYYIHLKGWENVRSLYTPISNELADSMVKSMKEQLKTTEEINIRFKCILGKNKEFSCGCELLLSDKIYTIWYFDGYLLLKDWGLSKDWYTYDFKDGKQSDTMLTTLLKEIDKMFKAYAKDNNIQNLPNKK